MYGTLGFRAHLFSTVIFTETPTTAAAQGGMALYYYDGNGTMVKSVIGEVVTYYASPAYQVKSDGTNLNTRKYYAFGSTTVAMRENGIVTWLMSDQVNSTTVTASEDGTLASEIKYTAFGEVRTMNGVTVTDNKYTGQREEVEIGLYYYVARYYDPALAHFIQADTVVSEAGNALGWDRYTYTQDNPLRYTDPSGHFPWLIIPFIIGLPIFMSQVPGDTYSPENPGNPNVMLIGLSLMSPAADFVATSVDCISNGCEPVTSFSSFFVPGPSPSMVDNTIDSLDNTIRASDDISSLAPQSSYNRVVFQNRTVYQRDDIFDIGYIDPKKGITNYERMLEGKSPIGYDRKPVNLHHLLQQEPGPIVEVTESLHQRGLGPLHGLVERGNSFRNNSAKVTSYSAFRNDYWKWRAYRWYEK